MKFLPNKKDSCIFVQDQFSFLLVRRTVSMYLSLIVTIVTRVAKPQTPMKRPREATEKGISSEKDVHQSSSFHQNQNFSLPAKLEDKVLIPSALRSFFVFMARTQLLRPPLFDVIRALVLM